MESISAVIVFALIFVVVAYFFVNITQKSRKLLPEFINGKPSVVFFWLDNQTCRAMSSIVDKIKNDFNGSVKVLTFNVVKNYEMAENYLVFDIPLIILFDKEGNQVIRITKPNEYPKLEAKLKEII
ncbi:Thioredoxin [Candidatus Kryptonium thompsonii]|uniref:Thioredoxin n=2 Tax=Candidatus Kryptonium thompsonii TaxID=1633631 RepID=A0A0P1P6M9_9BACT|nr:thioredoxin family protein [Candidatus Kryptonium thompsoni]CUS78818.1 Thioredoxin [Candidatus Kryptonium thompsoni]CUS91110.1 Thioredoxin [Candidatus Kryptonium thompsoni]CUS94234.1 Thioredoxin [Candidatus Kryptonium thompsoni]CUS95199.1 Thioredoxin [Candidatus Kryptonium thompsoni]CUS95600.1 Thioredoxin [Candidatus Kryptonium thompsoni]